MTLAMHSILVIRPVSIIADAGLVVRSGREPTARGATSGSVKVYANRDRFALLDGSSRLPRRAIGPDHGTGRQIMLSRIVITCTADVPRLGLRSSSL
jgi:hypothetical protein